MATALPRPDHDGADRDEPVAIVPAWLRETPYWAISGFFHLILFAILFNIFTAPPAVRKTQVPIQIKPIPRNEDIYDPKLERDMQKTPRILHETTVERLVIEREPDEVTPDIPEGSSLENETNLRLLSDHLNDRIGVGGGRAGRFGERWGKGSLINEGGSPGTEAAVRAALEWLKRHQSPDGSWKARDFTRECDTVCTSKNAERYGDGRGFPEHDVGVTALAMLAFAAYGHTHQDGRYRDYVKVLQRAVKYMLSVQVQSSDPNENGRYGESGEGQWVYDHSIATMAMGELLAMSGDILNLKRSVTDAVELCLHAQNTDFGWKYGIKDGRNDTSVTGWMVLALKTGRDAGLDISAERYRKAFDGALHWFDSATSSATGKTGYEAPGDDGSRLGEGYPEPYPYSKDLSCMTAVALLCRLFAGESRGAPVIKKGVDVLMRETPRWREQEEGRLSTINVYYWYYASYAMFQFGGQLWKTWNDDMIKALVSNQRQEFDSATRTPRDEDGSWDPIGEWGLAGGRVYATAIGAMTLEVYYRFTRAQEGSGF